MKALIIILLIISGTLLNAYELGEPKLPFAPKTYAAPKIDEYIFIDGKITDTEWLEAKWTDYFVDIEGDLKPEPRYRTRVKMMWNDYYFYIAAKLSEKHVWGTLDVHDSVIFQDNDFEVFIDPDGDTHNYYELEINALGTIWDLLLLHPYRDGGQVAIDSWDIHTLQSAVYVDGTINDPDSPDIAWYVELAIPWEVLGECAQQSPPLSGDYWRVNFSRVEWQHEIVDGKYQKVAGQPEDNWVWSPQGLINMHYPEMWGYVYFVDKTPSRDGKVQMFIPEEKAKWLLRQVYYRNYSQYRTTGVYTSDIEQLGLMDIDHGIFEWPPLIEITTSTFEATISLPNTENSVHINNMGKTWKTQTVEP
ncbi:MAG: carbohydrate-binding family 9-like protein [Candidatus Cloacimonetes bacterium]|nr:carbohydrate-binding family 9-like protein [Candidatus Cloacimonadota bacterium]